MSNKKQSSQKMATKASKTLNSNKASSLAKSLAGSVMAQAKGKKK